MARASGEARGGAPRGFAFSRRAALGLSAAVLPLGLAGCSLFDSWFGENKPPLPGRREPIMGARRGLVVDETGGSLRVALPPPTDIAAWPQAGGGPSHLVGHVAGGAGLGIAWNVDIGQGGGYRDKILAQPVVAGGIVFTMDSDAVVSAFDLANGGRRWRTDTKGDDDDSTNVGGGLAVEGDIVYAVNGLAELVALDAASGRERWRKPIGGPARSAPLVADGRLFVVTLDDKLVALAADDGRQLWTHQGAGTTTTMLGQPAPAYADGLVVAGFGSGEMASLRAETGGVAWTDSLASGRGRSSLADIAAIRGLPVIADGRVYAIGLGGLLVAIDLRSGRRLWERDVAGADSPWVAGDWLFVISTDQQLAAVQRQDGRVAWVADLPRWGDEEKQQEPIYWFGPLLAAERLIVAGTNGEALALSPFTGERLGRTALPGPASLGPVAAHGSVLIVTDDGRMVALR